MATITKRVRLWNATKKYLQELNQFPLTKDDVVLPLLRELRRLILQEEVGTMDMATSPESLVSYINSRLEELKSGRLATGSSSHRANSSHSYPIHANPDTIETQVTDGGSTSDDDSESPSSDNDNSNGSAEGVIDVTQPALVDPLDTISGRLPQYPNIFDIEATDTMDDSELYRALEPGQLAGIDTSSLLASGNTSTGTADGPEGDSALEAGDVMDITPGQLNNLDASEPFASMGGPDDGAFGLDVWNLMNEVLPPGLDQEPSDPITAGTLGSSFIPLFYPQYPMATPPSSGQRGGLLADTAENPGIGSHEDFDPPETRDQQPSASPCEGPTASNYTLPQSSLGSPAQDIELPYYTDMVGLSKAIEGIPPTSQYNLDWGLITRQDLSDYLQCFQLAERVTSALVNYSSKKLSQTKGILALDSSWCSDDTLLYTPQHIKHSAAALAPYCHAEHWSLIYVVFADGCITHYISPNSGDSDRSPSEKDCDYCIKVTSILASLRVSQGLQVPAWKFKHPSYQWQDGGGDCGAPMLWLMRLLAAGRDEAEPLPEDYRFILASEILEDIRSYRQKQALRRAIGGHGYNSAKRKFNSCHSASSNDELPETPSHSTREKLIASTWKTLPKPYGSTANLHKEWCRLSRLCLSGTTLDKLERASRLLQLVINIASQDVFIGLKHNVAHLRSQSQRRSAFTNDIHGIYSSGVWHTGNKESSTISLRLISWYIYDEITNSASSLQKRGAITDARSALVDKIHKNLPETLREDVEDKIKKWYHQGREWSQIVKDIGNVGVLFFLPRDVNIFPNEKTIGCNEYRDLKASESKELKNIFDFVRPYFRPQLPKDFSDMFIYRKVTSKVFQIELWTDESISRLELDSPKFLQAFEWADIDEQSDRAV
ncbi:uncharacterized protein GIQ15_03613 [Arthroderma uncinatum]|uniref:uncharacterized protein n=1 Tax=Arthroderma uncinatum TaxID=74035 RepID=UPI00144A55B7|nr:uncharacterized protein GIQ15_03613 [Arthroderma uncinatum]KAF3484289.1 hypothetical protein GIQ15_03613 [Arthroderma uncinatum]